MSELFTSITERALRNLIEAALSFVDSTANPVKRAREADVAVGFAIPELQRLVAQFYGEVERLSLDLYEDAIQDRSVVDGALLWLSKNLSATARSGSLLGDAKSASAHIDLIKNWYQQAQTRSYGDETRAI
jgi:hypothetical protein